MKLKYIIYCRRSQDREDQQTLSIESQRRELLKVAKAKGLNIVSIIEESKSAYKRGRPEFNKMMNQIENGEANAILTWHLTRLARNGADGGLIITLIDEKKIKELRTPEKVYVDNSDDKFMMTIHFAMAKKSSDDTSAFVRNNVKTKLEKGEYPGVVPYGYVNTDIHGVISGKRFDNKKQALLEQIGRPLKRIEVDPIEGVLIRKLIDLALTGAYSIPMLQEEAFKIGMKGKISGKKIAKQTLINILTNIFYTGRFKYLDEIHQGVHEPLMTEDEYQKIQEILKSRSRPKKYTRDYFFSGRVLCPECSYPMSGDFQKKKHYYRCGKAKGENATCDYKTYIRQDTLEEEMIETLKKVQIPERIINWSLKYLKQCYLEENKVLTGKQTLIDKSIAEEERKLERLTAKWLGEKNLNGELISDEDYKNQKNTIKEKIELYKEQSADNDNEKDNWLSKCETFFEKVRNISGEYKSASTLVDKRIVLNSIGAKFIRQDEKMTVQLEEPFSIFMETKTQYSSSRPLKKRSNKPESTVLIPEMDFWLLGLDSNQ